MHQCGANTEAIQTFISELIKTKNFDLAFAASDTPIEAKDFVNFTFKVIDSGKPHLQAAIFTFGREDLIPGMFISIINDLHKNFPSNISIFKYYLERHIEVDGDHHSHLALQMTENLCADNLEYWEEAEVSIRESLHQRISLWDGAYNQIIKSRS